MSSARHIMMIHRPCLAQRSSRCMATLSVTLCTYLNWEHTTKWRRSDSYILLFLSVTHCGFLTLRSAPRMMSQLQTSFAGSSTVCVNSWFDLSPGSGDFNTASLWGSTTYELEGGGLYFTSKRVATFKGRKIERTRRKIRTWRNYSGKKPGDGGVI